MVKESNMDLMTLKEIYYGYKWLILSKFGYWDKDIKAERDRKAKICTEACPLRGKYLGIVPMCDMNKAHEGEQGCGCVIEAKLWSDSECPLGKF